MRLKERLYYTKSIKQTAKKAASLFDCKIAVVTDERLSLGIGKDFYNELVSFGRHAVLMVLPIGEGCKTAKTALELVASLLSLDFSANDALIAVGGGSICDLCGFAASIYKRGLRHAFVATTLLAAADAAIGGKTAIDADGIKNAVGSFYEPEAVFVASKAFETLSEKDILSGRGEIFKCAIIDRYLIDGIQNSDFLLQTKACAKLKLELVKKDFYDKKGIRRVLNLGHTFGHAIESESKLLQPHGICVAQGVLIAARLSFALGELSQKGFAEISSLFTTLGFSAYAQPLDKLQPYLINDKKSNGQSLELVLPTDTGVCLRTLPLSELYKLLDELNC